MYLMVIGCYDCVGLMVVELCVNVVWVGFVEE